MYLGLILKKKKSQGKVCNVSSLHTFPQVFQRPSATKLMEELVLKMQILGLLIKCTKLGSHERGFQNKGFWNLSLCLLQGDFFTSPWWFEKGDFFTSLKNNWYKAFQVYYFPQSISRSETKVLISRYNAGHAITLKLLCVVHFFGRPGKPVIHLFPEWCFQKHKTKCI